MNRFLLRTVLGALALTLGVAPLLQAFNVLSPQDFIIAIDLDPPATNSSYPGGEPPSNAINGTIAKYLNFGGAGSGFIVTPVVGSSTVQSFQITTANDAEGRDPSSFQLFGTNDLITSADNSGGLAENWTLIDGFDLNGGFALPAVRNTLGPLVPITNTSGAFTSYKMLYPTLKTGPLMQIAEVSFFPNADGSGADILNAGDPIRAVHFGPQSRYPLNESPPMAIDANVNTKYLNFGKENTGVIVTPLAGATAINGFQITTANDTEGRDPASWTLYGTNDAITSDDNSQGNEETWTVIESGALSLPVERLTPGAVVAVNNTTAYSSYRLVFPSLKNTVGAGVDSMQIAEVQFFSPGLDAHLEVNRDTGEMRLVAGENIAIGGYQIQSLQNGSLDDSAWTSITDTSADPNDVWTIVSDPGDPFILEEEDTPAGANDGKSIASGNFYSLGETWLRTPLADDVLFRLKDANGNLIATDVVYTGAAVVTGDYNADGVVTSADWAIYRTNLGSAFEGVSLAQAYTLGDLDGDFDNDLDDFNLFVEAGGGLGALFGDGTTVPEPSSIVLWICAGLGLIGYRRFRSVRKASVAVFAVALATALTASQAKAQTFVSSGNVVTATSPDANEAGNAGPINLFDDTFLNADPSNINGELFNLDYASFTVPPLPLQYAGAGAAPKRVFMDFGATIDMNWFAYAQRSGGDPTADRVGMFEFWFSDTDFANILPGTDPDAVLKLSPDDPRVQDSVLRPYSLSGEHSGRYVAMRITVSELSANQPTNNIGGHEFRLMEGPSDIVLQVDRSNGNMTMSNNGSLAEAIDIKAYEIRSDAGGLDAGGFNGIRGDNGAFPMGNGTGNGWEVAPASNSIRLIETYLTSTSTMPIGVSALPLGSAYNELAETEDLIFRYTNSQGHVYDGRVEYVGVSPTLLGDYNGDGVVNAADYVRWRDSFGSTTANLPGDTTPALVDESDYDRWVENFGNSNLGSGAGATSVPEPSTLSLVGLGIATVGAFGARRRFR